MTRSTLYHFIAVTASAAILAAILAGRGQPSKTIEAQAAPGAAPASRGSQIAYTVQNNGLYVANVNGTNDRLLKSSDLNTQIANISWSPDGQSILYTWRGIGQNGAEINKICSVAADGSSDRCIIQDTQARYFAPSWSPDGASILFVATFFSALNKNGIYIMSADGSSVRRLLAGANEYTRPLWSPDGTRIAFNLYLAGQLPLFIMDANGANPHSLTSGYDVYGLSWSPDGRSIAFNTLTASYVIDAAGGAARQLPYKPATKDTRLRWSPDGTQIIFDSDHGSQGRIKLQNIYRTSANGANVVQLTNDLNQNVVLGWSPDGAQILFSSNRQGKARVYVMDTAGKNPRQLSKNEQVREAAWQP